MNASQQWPLLNNQPDHPVTEADRDRAERFLHQAFRDGRLNTPEFEQRFTNVMNAARSSQLTAAVSGVAASVSQALVPAPNSYSQHRQGQHRTVPAVPDPDTGIASLAHFVGLFTWIIGPILIYRTARPGSLQRREAAKAFNFQLVASISLLAIGIVVGGILGLGGLVSLAWLAWCVLTVMGGVKATAGADWTNPLNKLIRLKVLPTDGS